VQWHALGMLRQVDHGWRRLCLPIRTHSLPHELKAPPALGGRRECPCGRCPARAACRAPMQSRGLQGGSSFSVPRPWHLGHGPPSAPTPLPRQSGQGREPASDAGLCGGRSTEAPGSSSPATERSNSGPGGAGVAGAAADTGRARACQARRPARRIIIIALSVWLSVSNTGMEAREQTMCLRAMCGNNALPAGPGTRLAPRAASKQ
jgi:hypothetical protein